MLEYKLNNKMLIVLAKVMTNKQLKLLSTVKCYVKEINCPLPLPRVRTCMQRERVCVRDEKVT